MTDDYRIACMNCMVDDLERAIDHARVDLEHDRKTAERQALTRRTQFTIIEGGRE